MSVQARAATEGTNKVTRKQHTDQEVAVYGLTITTLELIFVRYIPCEIDSVFVLQLKVIRHRMQGVRDVVERYIESGKDIDLTVQSVDFEPGAIHLVEGIQSTLSGHSDAVKSCAVDAERLVLYTASWDCTCSVWDLMTMARKTTLTHDQWVNCVCIVKPPIDLVATATEDGKVYFWCPLEFAVVIEIQVCISPVAAMCGLGDVLLCSSFAHAFALSPGTGTVLREFSAHKDDINCIAGYDDVMYTGGDDRRIICWDVADAFPVRELKGHTGAVRALLVQGSRLFSGGDDKQLMVWSLQTGLLIKALSGHTKPIRSLACRWSKVAENVVFSGSLDGKIWCWSAKSLKGVQARHFLSTCIAAVSDDVELMEQEHTSDAQLIAGDFAGSLVYWKTSVCEAALM
jgi:WD40 repeat protein